jgi:hypothetical protein
MLNELQTWWQNATPETRTTLGHGGVAVGALLGGHILGGIVARTLRAWNFDAILRLTQSSPPGMEPGRGLTPSRVAGILVRLTVWAAAAWWLAGQYDRPDIAATLWLVTTRTWALTAVIVVALAVGSLLANRVTDCLNGFQPAAGLGASRNGAAPNRAVAGAVGAGIYLLVILLTLLTTADHFDWPLTRTSAAALWGLAQQLLTAGAALLIASLGARWARNQMATAAAGSPEHRAGQYAALAIVGGTTALAVVVVLFNIGFLFALLAVPVLGGLLWLARGHLPDVMAGLQLRADQVCQVWFQGAPWQVREVGPLTTEVGRGGECSRVQNRLVLEAAAHGVPAAAGRR